MQFPLSERVSLANAMLSSIERSTGSDATQEEVDARVASGQYADEESVLREGVEILRKRDALVERLQESRRQ